VGKGYSIYWPAVLLLIEFIRKHQLISGIGINYMSNRLFIFSLIASLFIGNCYGLSAAKVYDKVHKSVVLVYVLNKVRDYPKPKFVLVGQGSGVAVRHNLVATNCHVALAGEYLFIRRNRKVSKAILIAENRGQDICLLKVMDMTLLPVTIRPSDSLVLGEDVYAFGSPTGIENFLSKGILSKIEINTNSIFLYTDVTTSFGSSGGGLFDSEGRLIGITTLADKTNPNISISAAADYILQKLNLTSVLPDSTPEDKSSSKKPKDVGPTQSSTPQLLGIYGDSRVQLYLYFNDCFLLLPMRDTSGVVIGTTLWFPEKRRVLFIHPNSTKLQPILEKLKKSGKKGPLRKAHSKLLLNHLYYNVYLHPAYFPPLLLALFPKDPTMTFVEGDYLELSIYYSSTKEFKKRTVGLWGFSEALTQYNAKCLKKP